MASRIKGFDGSTIGSSGTSPVDRVSRTLPAGSQTPNAQGAGDSVTITDSARQLSALAQTTPGGPEIDSARVSALQTAIESGQYTINPERIADGLLQMDMALGALAQ